MKASIRIIPDNNVHINLYKVRNGKYFFDKIHGKHDSSIDYKIVERVKQTHKIDYGTRVSNYLRQEGWNNLDLKNGNWLQTWFKLSQDKKIKENNIIAFRYWLENHKKGEKAYIDARLYYDSFKNELHLSHNDKDIKIMEFKEYDEKKWQYAAILFKVQHQKNTKKQKFVISYYNYIKDIVSTKPVELFSSNWSEKPYLKSKVPIQATFTVSKVDNKLSEYNGLLFYPTFYKTYLMNDYFIDPRVNIDFDNYYLTTGKGQLENLQSKSRPYAESRAVFLDKGDKVTPFYGKIVVGDEMIRITPETRIFSNPMENNKLIYGEINISNKNYVEQLQKWKNSFKLEHLIYRMDSDDGKKMIEINHYIERKEEIIKQADGKYKDITNKSFVHRIKMELTMFISKNQEVGTFVYSKDFTVEDKPDQEFNYQFWIQTEVDNKFFQKGEDNNMVKLTVKDNVGSFYQNKVYPNHIENPMNFHYIINSLDKIQADFNDVLLRARAFTITLLPFNIQNDNIIDENAYAGSALYTYSAACSKGYTLRSNGLHSKCFKKNSDKSQCYKLEGLCIACKETVIQPSCFACEPQYKLNKNHKCAKEEIKMPDLRSWANKARKLKEGEKLTTDDGQDNRNLQKKSAKI